MLQLLTIAFAALASASNVVRQISEDQATHCINTGACPEALRNSTCLSASTLAMANETCLPILCSMADPGNCTDCLKDNGGITGEIGGFLGGLVGDALKLLCPDNSTTNATTSGNATTGTNATVSGNDTQSANVTADGNSTANGTNGTTPGNGTAPAGDGSGTVPVAPVLALVLAVAGAAALV